MQTIIAIADNKEIFDNLFTYSILCGLRFKITCSSEEALNFFMENRTPLFIVECSDTNIGSLKFIKRLAPACAVFAVSKSADEEVAISALKNGAAQFLRLPCGSREFYYRLVNFIRMLNLDTGMEKIQIITLGKLKIYPQNNQAMLDGEFIPLTATEFKLLILLVNKLNTTVTLEELYLALYDTENMQYTSRVVSVHISKLRHKLRLNDLPYLQLANIHGKGYSLKYTPETENRNNG